MVEKVIVKVAGQYSENDWTNPRTGESKLIRSIQLVMKNGRESFVAEANDDLAKTIGDMNLKPDTPALVNLSFDAQESVKDNVVRYYQRVRIVDFVSLAFWCMARLLVTKEQRRQLIQKFGLKQSTMSEIVHFRRPTCQRHAEVTSYAVNELGATIVDL